MGFEANDGMQEASESVRGVGVGGQVRLVSKHEKAARDLPQSLLPY